MAEKGLNPHNDRKERIEMAGGRLVPGELAKAQDTAGRKTLAGAYTVFKDGTTFYGESLKGTTDITPAADPTGVLNGAISNA